MTDRQKRDFYGWINIALLFLCYCLIYGVVFNGFSVLFPTMIKAMRWARGDAAIAQTIRGILIGFMAPVAAFLINRWGTRKTLIFGGIITITSLLLLGTVVTELWQWIILWGIGIGFGLAMCGLVTIQTNITFWFSKNRGMAIGIVGTGGAIGGICAQPFFTWLITTFGQWRIGWLAAAVCAVLGIVGIYWLRDKPSDYGQYPDGISPEEAKEAEAVGRPVAARTYRTQEAWLLSEATRTRILWFLMICYCVNQMNVFIVVTHGVLHMTDKGYTAMQAAYVLSLFLLFVGFARIPSGWLADFIETRWLLAIAFALQMVGMSIIWQAPSLTMLIVGASIYGFSTGSVAVLMPTTIGNYYGASAFANISGFMFPFVIGISAMVPMLAGYAFDIDRSYDLAFIVLIVFTLISTLFAILARPPRKAAS